MKKVLLLAPMESVHFISNNSCINALRKLNCQIHLAANFNSDVKAVEGWEDIKIHNLPFARSSLFKNLSAIKKSKKLFKKENFDLIHCHTETGGFITRLTMRKKTKYIFTPHGMSFCVGSSKKSWLIYYPIEKWICKKMNANISFNNEEVSLLKKWNVSTARYTHGIGLDVEKVKNTEVDFSEKRRTLTIPLSAKLIASVGEINENKNHKVILNILDRLPEDVYYIICGVGSLEKELKAYCKEKSIEKRVIFAGYRDDIYEILKITDIFAFPSFREGLPVSVMEAMAAGLPVVCSDIRGNKDLIRDNEGGFLCDPKNPDMFLTAIDKILNSDEMKIRMSSFNSKEIEKFDISVVENEMFSIYENILSGR